MINPEKIKVGDVLLCEVPIMFMEKYPYTTHYNGQKFEVIDIMDVFNNEFNSIKAIIIKGIDIPDSFKIGDEHYDWYTKVEKY